MMHHNLQNLIIKQIEMNCVFQNKVTVAAITVSSCQSSELAFGICRSMAEIIYLGEESLSLRERFCEISKNLLNLKV